MLVSFNEMMFTRDALWDQPRVDSIRRKTRGQSAGLHQAHIEITIRSFHCRHELEGPHLDLICRHKQTVRTLPSCEFFDFFRVSYLQIGRQKRLEHATDAKIPKIQQEREILAAVELRNFEAQCIMTDIMYISTELCVVVNYIEFHQIDPVTQRHLIPNIVLNVEIKRLKMSLGTWCSHIILHECTFWHSEREYVTFTNSIFETEVAIGVREKCDPGLKSKWTQTQSIEGGPKHRACLFACTFSFNHGSWSLLQFSFGCGWWSRHTANPPWILGTLTSGVR